MQFGQVVTGCVMSQGNLHTTDYTHCTGYTRCITGCVEVCFKGCVCAFRSLKMLINLCGILIKAVISVQCQVALKHVTNKHSG